VIVGSVAGVAGWALLTGGRGSDDRDSGETRTGGWTAGRAAEREPFGVEEETGSEEAESQPEPEPEVFGYLKGLDAGVVFIPREEGVPGGITVERDDERVEFDRTHAADDGHETLTMVAIAPDGDRAVEFAEGLTDAEPHERNPDEVRVYYPEPESGGTRESDGSDRGSGVDDPESPRTGVLHVETVTADDITVRGIGRSEGMAVTTTGEQHPMTEEMVDRATSSLLYDDEAESAAVAVGATGAGGNLLGRFGRVAAGVRTRLGGLAPWSDSTAAEESTADRTANERPTPDDAGPRRDVESGDGNEILDEETVAEARTRAADRRAGSEESDRAV